MEKVYYKAIDYAKVICAILVVCIHTGPLLSVNEEMNFFLVQVLARMAVPFFFLSSAFFFFKKLDYSISLEDEQNKNKLKVYITHLLKMYLFWSLVYFSIQLVLWFVNGFSIHAILLYVRDFIFRGSYYHLWFLPALMFAMIFIYVLLSALKEEKVILIAFILYIVGMFINVYGDIFLGIPIIGSILNIYLTLFATSRNGLFFGSIFVILGYICARKKIRLNNTSVYACCIASFILLVLEVYFIRKVGVMNDLTCMYVFLLPFIFFLFQITLQFKSKEKGSLLLRNGSTLLYLIHCYFTFILQYVPIVNSNSLLYFIFTMLCSVGFIYGYLRLSEKFKWLRSVI